MSNGRRVARLVHVPRVAATLEVPLAGEEGGSRNEIARTEHVDLGDADAVEKSTYLGDRHGADVGGKADQPVHLTSSVRSERGLGPMGWIAALLALPGLVIYGARLFD